MKFKDEFQRADLAQALVRAIGEIPLSSEVSLMEVCGTHTHAIGRYGIHAMLPEKIRLLSGPGCPVCVTPNEYIDHALALSALPGVIIATFGDLFRVPGSYSSLQEEKGKGADVRVVYSPADALEMARSQPENNVIFLGVGFETTAPSVAAVIRKAREKGTENFFVLPGFKTLPNALEALASSPRLRLSGFIAPGHLSVVTGLAPYERVLEKYGIGSVITGFEPLDILEGIRLLTLMASGGKGAVINEYSRIVRPGGNQKAMGILEEVFAPADSIWRGLGTIPGSGLAIREKYSPFDAGAIFSVSVPPSRQPKGCICGEILTGVKEPGQCPSFGTLCTPRHPVGACMVSSEGTCSAYLRYGRSRRGSTGSP